MTARLRRLGDAVLPDSPAGRTLAVGAGVDSLGTGMFFASFALYFIGVVGLTANQIALATTIAGALALLAPVPLGRLADRVGPGRFYVALLLLRGIGYGCFALVSDFTAYLVLTVLLTAADRASSPIQQAVVTAVIGGHDRTRTMATIRAIRNVGLTAGFLLAGVVFVTGTSAAFTALFLGNGISFVVIAFAVRLVLRTGTVVQRTPLPAGPGPTETAVRSPFRDRWFMVFTVGNGVLSLYDTVLIVLLPIWVIEYTSVPLAWVPVLMAVNTVLTVVLQVYVARFAEGTSAAARLLTWTGALMAFCCGALAVGQMADTGPAIAAVVVAVVALSIAENIHSVAAWELSAELSPQPAVARYLGAFSLGMTGQKVLGPTILVVVLLPTGLLAWPVLAGTFGAAALVSRTAAHRSLAERARTKERPAGDLPALSPFSILEVKK
ncbi:MFS transporter [Rhodococcus sp. SC4]|uniref:MFS transporter n=1 Tax=Rhodococcus sp. LB1 TaxID=1807499 RepID=UPI000769FFF8|nr:MFS transporter [Rhodococcus sp. LB1]KXF54527.1 MFS transporter [Rhodococcus sp. SC4]KXX63071.1 MFS transporter [Rhodococcus sp. LB1]